MYAQKQQRPGYYAALRQNRKIMNKRLRHMERMAAILDDAKISYSRTEDDLLNKINALKSATLWKRFLYMVTGDIKRLV